MENVKRLIARVKGICQQCGWDVKQHFVPTYKIVQLGLQAKRSIDDYHLSREAFLMVIQNADSEKLIVSIGKHYIVQQVLRSQNRAISHKRPSYTGSDELAYNSFRASLTKQKIEREQIQQEEERKAGQGPRLPLFLEDGGFSQDE
jgi:hypothetical protein